MKRLLFKNVNLLDGTKSMELKENIDVLVSGNTIEKIDYNITDTDAKIYDMTGKYMIPGLINMHVHMPASGNATSAGGNAKKLVKILKSSKIFTPLGVAIGNKYAKLELYSGVTTLRAVGGVSNYDSLLRDKINKGKATGPRMIVSNEAITVSEGHMLGTVSVEAKTAEEVKELVKERYNQGVDLIKIMITGGVLDAKVKGEPGVLRMNPEFVYAATSTAHELGLKVAAHVESYEGAKVALENGVDTIEHGANFDDYLISLFKKNNASLVCTISPAVPLALLPPHFSKADEFAQYNTCVVAKNILDGASALLKDKDARIGLGTDTGCPFVTHYAFWRELEFFYNAFGKANGFDRRYSLYLATMSNASILGMEDKIGSVEVGKYADMVISENNPLENFSNLDNPYMVVKDGKVYQKKYKHIDYVDECNESLMSVELVPALEEYFKNNK